jgi:chaperone required for assembly of F1-ATPase
LSPQRVRRSYKSVAVAQGNSGYAVLLDGKPAKTPGGSPLEVPAAALADAIAEEWRAQTERLDPANMMLTGLANAAIDRAGSRRGDVIEHVLGFGRSDLVCYRAESPPALAARQIDLWDPLLAWARSQHGIRLIADAGISFVEQPADSALRMQALVSDLDDFALVALEAAASRTGSFVVALALVERHVDAEQAFAAAQLDELYQAEKWCRDPEAEGRRERQLSELKAVARFVWLLRQR